MIEIAAAPSSSARVEPLDRNLRAAKGSLSPEEHWRNRHRHKAGPGVTQDTIRHLEYWAFLAPKLRRHDLITILADDESWEIEACVERVLQDAAEISVRKVHKRQSNAHAGRVVDGVGNFFSEWRAGQAWCIVRAKDSIPVVQGHLLEATAIAEWQRLQPRKIA